MSGATRAMSGPAGAGCGAPIVDAHTHCRTGTVGLLVRALDLAEIHGAVVLGWPGENEAILEEAERLAPERLRVLVAPDLRLAGTAAWEAELTGVDRLLGRAAGIKLYKEASFGVTTADGRPVTLLSPELEPLWAIAASRSAPVLLHCGDPADSWRRRPRLRARHLEFHPEWRYYGRAGVPSRRWMIRCRDELLRRHPEVRFVGAHLGGFPDTAAELARFLALGPSDTSAALDDVLTFDRRAVLRLVGRHGRDVLWGSDVFVPAALPGGERTLVVISAKYMADNLRLATAADTVAMPSHECGWEAPGLALCGPLREAVLGRNAVRIYWGEVEA